MAKILKTSNKDSDITQKYYSSNPLVKRIMKNFLQDFDTCLDILHPKNVLELGCGEGFLSHRIATKFMESNLLATDINTVDKKTREENLKSLKNVKLKTIDATKTKLKDSSFDLVVCSEVLEHIPQWQLALDEIKRVSSKWVLLSVPREPMFRLLNLARGAYITSFGNFHEHVNHWSSNQFINLLESQGFQIVKVKKPVPWTIVLARVIK